MEIGLVLILALLSGGITWVRTESVIHPEPVFNDLPEHPGMSIRENTPPDFPERDPKNIMLSEAREWFGKIFEFEGAPLERRFALLRLIATAQSLDYEALEETFGVSRKTLKRDLTALKNLNLITFTGAPKTGRYILTSYGRYTWQTL